MQERFAVVGAGIAGLMLARELRARGREVVVLEKSRGFGGRLATKRIDAAVFDSGAQYFTAKTPRFADLIEEWSGRGVVRPWPGASGRRWIAHPSMNALGKYLAQDIEVRREAKVVSVQRENGDWRIEIDNAAPLVARSLALTAPVPQSLALIKAGGVALPEPLLGELNALTYHPCLALLLILEGPSQVPADGLAFSAGPVRWLADNTRKGVSPGSAAAVTVHLSPAFAAEHYQQTEQELAAAVLPVISPYLGSPVAKMALHRWRYSEPVSTHTQSCVWLEDLQLGFAGDALGGPRVEGAALSGLKLAQTVLGAAAPLH
jgi:renalase